MYRSVKGMNDRFEPELSLWRLIEDKTYQWFLNYGYEEIRTPLLENLSLFVRSVGETTDIVEKEMYVLKDRDESLLALRPENTASVARAVIESGRLAQDNCLKLFYQGPMFRRERPQKGRLRQFHQVGAELFGVASPKAEIELLTLLGDYFKDLGVENIVLKLNTLGKQGERDNFKKALLSFFEDKKESLCIDCQRRLYTNTLRVLDCKKEGCKALVEQAPSMREFLDASSVAHFEDVQNGLSLMGISFELDPRLVRGLDYYTSTVFEWIAKDGLGSQNALAAGGRYDHLVSTLGGPNTPAVGFALGVERLMLLLGEPKPISPPLMLVGADEVGRAKAILLGRELRALGLRVEIDLTDKSVKAQMRQANRLGVLQVLVLGEREVGEEKGFLKSMNESQKEPKCVMLSGQAIFEALL